MGNPEIPKEWKEGKVKPLLEIRDGESFHMVVQSVNPLDETRGWRVLSKKKKDGKIESVIYFGTFNTEGIIETKENVLRGVFPDEKVFTDGLEKILTDIKEIFPNIEIRVLNLQGLTMGQAVNRIKESGFGYVWEIPKKGDEDDGS